MGEGSRGGWLAKGMEKRLGRVFRQSGAQTGSKKGGMLDQERAEVERHDQNGNLILGRGRKGCWKGLQHYVMWALIVKSLGTKVGTKSEGATLGFQDTESGIWIGSDNEH